MSISLRSFLGMAGVALLCGSASAQSIKLNGFAGYTFQDKFQLEGTYYGYSYYEAVIEEGAHYGGSFEFEIRRNKSIELLYQNMPTQGYFRGSSALEDEKYDVSLNYIMLGGMNYMPFSQTVKGYGGLNLGVAFATGDAEATKFAWGGKLGLSFDLSPTVSLKMGAQLLSAVQGAGGGFYFGTGGASAGVSTYSSIYQFGFTGGLCFNLSGGSSGPSSPKPASSGSAPAPPPPSAPPPPPPPPPQY